MSLLKTRDRFDYEGRNYSLFLRQVAPDGNSGYVIIEHNDHDRPAVIGMTDATIIDGTLRNEAFARSIPEDAYEVVLGSVKRLVYNGLKAVVDRTVVNFIENDRFRGLRAV